MIIRHPIGLAQLVGWFFLLLATIGSFISAWDSIHLDRYLFAYAGPEIVCWPLIAILGLYLVAIDKEKHENARLMLIATVTLTLVPIVIFLIASLI